MNRRWKTTGISQYLFEMVQAGDNTLEQKKRILHKVVDEQWLTVIEDGIEAIFNIVDEPRRFIKSSEEVVPVALAKKDHGGQCTPFKPEHPVCRNSMRLVKSSLPMSSTVRSRRAVSTLYENRFVYHLIERLFAFVDKRPDVIFWSTGDETCNVMSMQTKVDDAYEEISYRVEVE